MHDKAARAPLTGELCLEAGLLPGRCRLKEGIRLAASPVRPDAALLRVLPCCCWVPGCCGFWFSCRWVAKGVWVRYESLVHRCPAMAVSQSSCRRSSPSTHLPGLHNIHAVGSNTRLAYRLHCTLPHPHRHIHTPDTCCEADSLRPVSSSTSL